ncbi:D-alanyl-D-alanine endopeptidase [Haliea salexigens]|jgi:D-alanyl-D-alanine endopeptidase (penicillin-binding protein 7)|nr:D-alanyl-D-alanine endopeptidase [Haliea salexigens]MAA88118.1 D-alanyl-D-alanine endopeptidase [Haliea sp.]|tara:strand:+ start:5836 stop:6669 length:834 start_codon:yes stop_codon:yes gene_type:complete
MKNLPLAIGLLALCVLTSQTASAGKFSHLSGNPDLRSASALVLDGSGEIIYGKDTDTVRPIASITKLMTAMVTLDAGLPLDAPITVTREDRDVVRQTGSRLDYGATLSREEMLLLALMSSENRAASALGRTYPGGLAAFVQAMNRKAEQLGMRNSRFADPAGLHAGNQSTARDLAIMVRAAGEYPLIAKASTTKGMAVQPFAQRGPLNYNNTNRLLKNQNWQIGLSKTGYLNEAGRCLVMQATIEGEPVSIVLLNSFGKLTPFGDSNRLRRWLLAGR